MAEKIGPRQMDDVIGWLRERTNATCPFCGGRRWTVDDELAGVPAYARSQETLQVERGHTLLLVTCEECGFSAPFAARKLPVAEP